VRRFSDSGQPTAKCSVNRPLTPNGQSRGSSGRCSCCEFVLPLYKAHPLTGPLKVRELYEVLRTATQRTANLLNENIPTHRLPPEILTRILRFAVDHGFEEHAEQIIPLTHVCQYWRTLLLSHPRMWSTLWMKPGNPSIISEWLMRSQDVPLTVIAEFADAYEHPPCRYHDSATTTLVNVVDLGVCPRHKAVLSLDQLLPHRSRIRDLDILIHSSDPDWDDGAHDGEPTLFNHCFFRETLPNLQHLSFRAAHVEQEMYMIPVPDSLFAGELPRLKELKYLGVVGGLTETAKNLASCEIGRWSGSAGPTIVSPNELQTLLNNNKTVKSLTINDCELFARGHEGTATTSMTDLKFLKVYCPFPGDLESILNLIRVPQFKSLHTVWLSIPSYSIQAVATDDSGHTFEFSQPINHLNFHPLRNLGADITTLRLDPEMTIKRLNEGPALHELFQPLDAVQALEFDGSSVSVRNVNCNVLSIPGVFPGLKVIRVAISRDICEDSFKALATASRLRMEEGNPLAMIEPLLAEGIGESGLGQELLVEWEKRYEAEGIRNFLSK